MKKLTFTIILFLSILFYSCDNELLPYTTPNNNPEYLIAQANELYLKGDYIEALEYFNNALQIDSTLLNARRGRARTRFALYFNTDNIIPFYYNMTENHAAEQELI